MKNEYVVHSAHLDHLGVGRVINGDSIYNGAHDNASGVAALLEIARIYISSGAKPKRSILIAMVTGEEMRIDQVLLFCSQSNCSQRFHRCQCEYRYALLCPSSFYCTAGSRTFKHTEQCKDRRLLSWIGY
ncbi:MAG: M28 family peptidase [Chitinophagaceae bacterium]|nr:M28 family peptidase [Chitinophagaceae bacterium]